MTAKDTRTSNEMAHDRTALAARRTLNAADRTLMAWIRTALSMISFGITIYKVLEGIQESGRLPHAATPQIIGLFLSGLGTVSMALGTVQYWETLRDLRTVKKFRLMRSSFIIAIIMSIGGFVMFVGIAYKVL